MNTYTNFKHKFLINKLKRLCYCPAYFAGCEIYRLLNYSTLPELAYSIKKGSIILDSKLLFGRRKTSAEEQFLYLVNKYIVFIRNNFFIHATEMVLILEETLKSKYSKVLYSHLDFNKGDNYKMFHSEFKKMFLSTLLENYKKYYNGPLDDPMLSKLKTLSVENNIELEEVFTIFKQIINFRCSNLYYCFVTTSDNDNFEYGEQFYTVKWNTLIRDYIGSLNK